jgi:hypothetical protein
MWVGLIQENPILSKFGWVWVALSLNPTLYLRGMLEEVVVDRPNLGQKSTQKKREWEEALPSAFLSHSTICC